MNNCINCSVCSDPVDLSDEVVCVKCGNSFHFGSCGDVINGEHVCCDCQGDILNDWSEDDEDL